jgi:serine/threonine protein kinase
MQPIPLPARLWLSPTSVLCCCINTGIEHRDLKSLNLLLDAKWNVKVGVDPMLICRCADVQCVCVCVCVRVSCFYSLKPFFVLYNQVSDFGLTKLKVNGRKGGHTDIAGSVHWMAPEVRPT